MARNFIALTQEEINIQMARGIQASEIELASYDFEQAAHESAISDLGDLKWNDSTKEYKGLDRNALTHRALENGLDSTAIQKLHDIRVLEDHKKWLEVVKAEIAKSERIYNHRLTLLPEGEARDVAIAALAVPSAK